MTENNDILWTDKLKISLVIQDKIGQLIGANSKFVKIFRNENLSEETLVKDESYINVWRLLQELFDILRYDKIEELKQRIGKKKYDQLIKIMEEYKDYSLSIKGVVVSISEMQEVYEILLEVCALAGYMNDTWINPYNKTNDLKFV